MNLTLETGEVLGSIEAGIKREEVMVACSDTRASVQSML